MGTYGGTWLNENPLSTKAVSFLLSAILAVFMVVSAEMRSSSTRMLWSSIRNLKCASGLVLSLGWSLILAYSSRTEPTVKKPGELSVGSADSSDERILNLEISSVKTDRLNAQAAS